MPEQEKIILGFQEKLALGLVGFLVILALFFWQTFRSNSLFSITLLAAILLAGAGYWFWRNYRLVDSVPESPVKIREKLEGILHTIFLPRGYHIITLPSVDEANIGWAVLRDTYGTSVIVQYIERPLEESIGIGEITLLDERMEEESVPKRICLATSLFDSEALGFARRKNILAKDSDQLIAMLKEAEEQSRKGGEYRCRYCGSKLEQSEGIAGYIKCPNPNCARTFTVEELEEEKNVRSGKTKTLTISCFGCSRPVELDITMSGLAECPYDDCSWIINVDNEILALKGGLDKRVSGRVEETSPGGERQARQVADRHTYLTVSTPGLFLFFIISISAFLTFVYFITQ
ncbi:hypothetical protein KA005_74255 [bacterium]|nr:hypothetical protein [bacterium]